MLKAFTAGSATGELIAAMSARTSDGWNGYSHFERAWPLQEVQLESLSVRTLNGQTAVLCVLLNGRSCIDSVGSEACGFTILNYTPTTIENNPFNSKRSRLACR
jgi:hypothetical protein